MSGDGWHHQNKEWQITLDLAKERGWPEPRPGSNHHTLLLACPAGVHQTPIFSTGRSSENVARNFRKKIRRCQHSSGAREIFAKIKDHLDSAEHWIEAAKKAVTLQATEQRLEKIIQDAQVLMAETEAEFDRLAATSDALDRELQEMVPTDPRPTTEELANYAHSDLRAANEKLRDAPTDSERLDALRSRHVALKARLHTVRHA